MHIRFSYEIFSNHCIIIKTLMVIMTLCPLCHLDAGKYSIFHEDQVSGDPGYGHNNTTFWSLDPEYIDGHLFSLWGKGRRWSPDYDEIFGNHKLVEAFQMVKSSTWNKMILQDCNLQKTMISWDRKDITWSPVGA